MMTDFITIKALALEMSIGAYAWEKQVHQLVFVDLELTCDTSKPGKSDQLEDSIDYATIANTARQVSLQRHYTLIESLAEVLAEEILRDSRILEIKIKITKPGAIPSAESVSVTVNRSN